MASATAAREESERTGRKRSSRDLLLDATGALMSEGNTTQVSFGDIAARSGISAALIRYHFGSKQGLLQALLERDAGGTYAALEWLVAAPFDPVEKMRRHILGIVKTYHRHPYINRLVLALQSDADSEIARFISDRFTRPLYEAEKTILEQGEREGVFVPVDPMEFHLSLLGACDSLFHARATLLHLFGLPGVNEDLRDRHADHVIGMTLRAICTPAARI